MILCRMVDNFGVMNMKKRTNKKKNTCITTGLSVGIILLFVGLALSPGITAQVNNIEFEIKDSFVDPDVVEVIVQCSNSQGAEDTTVKLSTQEANELEELLDDIQKRLDAAKTKAETIEVFKDAVVSLNELGLLPDGINIEQAQQLVTGNNLNERASRLLDRLCNRNLVTMDDNENALCLIAGKTDETRILANELILVSGFILSGLGYVIAELVLAGLLDKTPDFLWILLDRLVDRINDIITVPGILSSLINLCTYACIIGLFSFPLNLVSGIYVGHMGLPYPYPAHGWLFTIGLNGIKKWDGSFYGGLSEGYMGAKGFTGIKILDLRSSEYFYLGTALKVAINQ